MTNILLAILSCVITLISATHDPCPRQEDIAPDCICKDLGNGPMLQCTNIMSPEELVPPIKATDNIRMFSLTIMDSTLMYVPNGIFKHAKYSKIMFLNSQLMALSDSDLAFEGLEDTLEELRATGAHYITQWDWFQLRNHHRMELIDINMISMYSLDQQFPTLKKLRNLGISRAELSFLHPTAFQELENLQLIVLKNNDLKDLTRSMFPKNAHKLFHIDLSGNKIVSLPDDMFTKMPNLEFLSLENNQIKTLVEEVFWWPSQNLQSLFLAGNNILCDCRLRWMVNAGMPREFSGSCSLPQHMAGVSLKYLTNNNLWC